MSDALPEKEPRIGRAELLRVAACAAILLLLNAYVCRELFSVQTAFMNSMHGFWIALARHAGNAWFHPVWWPYWDAGIPFEFTYSPLVPAAMAAWHALSGISLALAFDRLTGLVYCAAPIVLFLVVWLMTRATGASFAAALIYSLSSPTQFLVPDPGLPLVALGDPRRLMLMTTWDETPHLAALVFLPLTILFLSLSIRKRQIRYYAAAAVSIAVATWASAFGPTDAAIVAVCLLAVVRRENLARNAVLIAGIGALAYALSAAFLPPSLIRAMRAGGASLSHGEPGWTAGSLTALAVVALGWTILWHFLPRWTRDWRLQFFALFAYLTSSIPMVFAYLHRQFLPQPGRYKIEMEMAISIVIAFAGRAWMVRLPVSVRRALLFLLIALSAEQLIHERQYAKGVLRPAEATSTIEYRTSVWVEKNLPGVRVMLPGSIAMWANSFAAIPQFSGSSWSEPYNRVQQRAVDAVYNGGATEQEDARTSIDWLKAFGVGAVAVSGPDSQEYWKPFAHPKKFDGVLPALWREAGVTIYKIPQRSASLAHVIPESALVRNAPVSAKDLEPYDTALDDPALPLAEFQWDGRNAFRIRESSAPGQVLSIQVSYHPGWRATANGRVAEIHRDGLGLMWLRPDCSGDCEVRLDYHGGAELLMCRTVTYAAILITILFFPVRRLIMK